MNVAPPPRCCCCKEHSFLRSWLRTLLQFNASVGNLRMDPQLGRAGLTFSGNQAVCEGWGLACWSLEVFKLIC